MLLTGTKLGADGFGLNSDALTLNLKEGELEAAVVVGEGASCCCGGCCGVCCGGCDCCCC